MIGLERAGVGIGDAGGPGWVVAHQQQTLAGLVQAADRRQPRQTRAFEAAVDGGAAAFVAGGGDQAARLVEHEVEALRGGELAAVHGQPVAVLAHRMLRVAHHPAVHRHAALAYPRGGLGA